MFVPVTFLGWRMHHHYPFLGHKQMELIQLELELVAATIMSQMHNLMHQVSLS
jgi:hypothetical protein